MQLVVVEGVDPTSIAHAVGNDSYVQGVRYAQQRAVVHMQWDAAESALQGTVRGSEGRLYSTVVYFVPRNGSDLEFEFGECSCPVGYDCKHTAALALTAAGAASPRTGASRTGASRNRPAVTWERSLGSLLEPDRTGSESSSSGTALAIELTLSSTPDPTSHRSPKPGTGPKLLARLVRPGKTGWVSGGLSWSKLGSLHYQGDYRASHVRLLHELYALYQSHTGPSGYYSYGYSYGDDKTIDLAAFGSRQLWAMLDEAAAIGVQMVHGRKSLGAVEGYGHAELCLDVTGGQGPGSLVVAPVLRVDGTRGDAVPVRFIGAEGHGVVYV
ncbi:MAG: SWIM zinc finger family protein, partial [Actinobacteria bacterium]|nr:SWIM zinc finger family protein [Actinomycetota bacterium]